MGNMSYCRFSNTLSDLRDCNNNLVESLSKEEHDARKKLIKLCKSIVDDCFDEDGEPVGDWNDEYIEDEEDEEEEVA